MDNKHICTLSFAGPIQYPATKNFRNACCAVVTEGVTDLRLLFASSGGSVEDGIALYHFLRALPVKLTIHSVGSVDSIAIAVFLAGEHRLCCEHSTFLFHDFTWNTAAQTVTRLQIAEQYISLQSGRRRMRELLKLRTNLTDPDLDALKFFEEPMVKTAGFAKEKGIVHEIAEAAVQPGTRLANIDY